jgi:hypothetical protein
VLLTASRRQLPQTIFSPPFGGSVCVWHLRRDAANNTPEACTPDHYLIVLARKHFPAKKPLQFPGRPLIMGLGGWQLGFPLLGPKSVLTTKF